MPGTALATIPGRNGGRLNAGGTRGNKGGTGRPPKEITALFRELRGTGKVGKAYTKVVYAAAMDPDSRHWGAILKRVLEPEELTRVSADILNRLERTIKTISSRPQWDASELLNELDPIWQE